MTWHKPNIQVCILFAQISWQFHYSLTLPNNPIGTLSQRCLLSYQGAFTFSPFHLFHLPSSPICRHCLCLATLRHSQLHIILLFPFCATIRTYSLLTFTGLLGSVLLKTGLDYYYISAKPCAFTSAAAFFALRVPSHSLSTAEVTFLPTPEKKGMMIFRTPRKLRSVPRKNFNMTLLHERFCTTAVSIYFSALRNLYRCETVQLHTENKIINADEAP